MQSNHQLATTVLINHVPKDPKDQKTQMQKIHTLAVPGILPKLSSRGSEVLIEVVLLALLPWYGSTQPPLGQGGSVYQRRANPLGIMVFWCQKKPASKANT